MEDRPEKRRVHTLSYQAVNVSLFSSYAGGESLSLFVLTVPLVVVWCTKTCW